MDTDPCDATRASAIFQKAVSSEVALSADDEEDEAGNLTFRRSRPKKGRFRRPLQIEGKHNSKHSWKHMYK